MRRDTLVRVLRWAWMATLAAGLLGLLAAWFVLDPNGGSLGPIALGVTGAGVLLLAAEDFARAGVRSDLPDRVGQTRLSAGIGLRLRMALALVIAVGVPAAFAAWVAVFYAWQIVGAGVIILAFTFAIQLYLAHRDRVPDPRPDPRVNEALERLCFRADLRVPAFAVAPDTEVATAWTSGGTIVVTTALLHRLDPPQLEAVLAHELAHLAHRDAPVMDVAAAPSRLLLSTWDVLGRDNPIVRRAGGRWLAMFMLPYALPLAWISRLAMLAFSRARDLRADSAAAVLTGSPAALASALLALDTDAARPGSSDLRAVRPLAVVDTARPRLGFLALHPSTGDRVERLQAMEETLQAGPA